MILSKILLESTNSNVQIDIRDPKSLTSEEISQCDYLINQLRKSHKQYDKITNLTPIKHDSDFRTRIYKGPKTVFSRVVLATLDDHIIGLMIYKEFTPDYSPYKESAAWLSTIVVDEKFRKLGVGSRMMSFIKQYVKKNRPVIRLMLGVSCHNTAGIALYNKFGFVPVNQGMVCKL